MSRGRGAAPGTGRTGASAGASVLASPEPSDTLAAGAPAPIAGIRMQRLRAAEDSRHGLQRHPDNVIIRLLGGQRAPRGLGVKAQHLRPWLGGVETVAHNPGPQPTRCPEFGDFLQKMVVDIEKER